MNVTEEGKNTYFNALISSMPFSIVVFDKNFNIDFVNDYAERFLKENDSFLTKEIVTSHLHKVIESETKVEGVKLEINHQTFFTHFSPVISSGKLIGIMVIIESLEMYGYLVDKLKSYKELSMDLKAIFDSAYDVIYVSDGNGKTLRVSSACERLWGKTEQDLIGKNVKEIESSGIYKPSVTRLVLESGKKVSTIQTTSTGRRLMVVGTPIKDEDGKIVRVVNASRDITEVSQLQIEIKEMKQLLNGYREELKELRKGNENQKKIIFQSSSMEKVLELSKRVAGVDSTVLILGESGVGKEVIANNIHRSSSRANKPFIKINCGAIPENLLESELFGYEKGAFTGANKDGKMGLFELANEGTLFLDEIAEMPTSLQVKLLRVLQDHEVMRVGGTKSMKVNVRIIAATNKVLEDEIKKQNFREDLYYRLNVVPLYIPPLRQRKEDIIPLILYFIDHFNQKYLTNKVISPNVLEIMQNYPWKGNVRELQNIVERLVVISDEHEITEKFLPETFHHHSPVQRVQVHDVLPFKECMDDAEKQLLTLARKKYGSTVKIAKALNLNQSTISRKLSKLNI